MNKIRLLLQKITNLDWKMLLKTLCNTFFSNCENLYSYNEKFIYNYYVSYQ